MSLSREAWMKLLWTLSYDARKWYRSFRDWKEKKEKKTSFELTLLKFDCRTEFFFCRLASSSVSALTSWTKWKVPEHFSISTRMNIICEDSYPIYLDNLRIFVHFNERERLGGSRLTCLDSTTLGFWTSLRMRRHRTFTRTVSCTTCTCTCTCACTCITRPVVYT